MRRVYPVRVRPERKAAMSKITAEHLGRSAYIYIRQSSTYQVANNLESQRRQYGLAERAQQLGWETVEVIDEDLGKSGGGGTERPGFQKLLAAICEGRVGNRYADPGADVRPRFLDQGVCCEHPGQRHREHEGAGRPFLQHEPRARVSSWPPLRLARLRRERESVVVVSPAAPAFCHWQGRRACDA